MKTNELHSPPPTIDAKEIDFVEDPPVVAWIDEENKKTYLVFKTLPQVITLIHTADPEYTDDKVRLHGKFEVDEKSKENELTPAIIAELIPYLETKIESTIITLKRLPFENLTERVKQDVQMQEQSPIVSKYNGIAKKFTELDGYCAVIVRDGKERAAILCTPEEMAIDRSIIVYKTMPEATLALAAFKTFPPFKENLFYKKAHVVNLKDLDSENLENEKFMYYDVWQKTVALLSNSSKQ